jgi:hypothetical protein
VVAVEEEGELIMVAVVVVDIMEEGGVEEVGLMAVVVVFNLLTLK